MSELQHGAFWFWMVILCYASWCAGNLWYSRNDHQRIDELKEENKALRKSLNDLRTEFHTHPLGGFMRRAN